MADDVLRDGAGSGHRPITTTTVTTRAMLFEARGWLRVACAVLGPLGLAVWIAFVATGTGGFDAWMWIAFALAMAGGTLFTLLAFRGSVRVPLGRTVVVATRG